MTLAAMLRRVNAMSLTRLAGDVIAKHTDELAELNRKQLMQGKNNEGKPLGPKHSENPFFKTPQAAYRYAKWKQRITPETPFDVPNLFINGYYHGSISFRVEADKVTAKASASFAAKIEQTYKNTALGLAQDAKETAFKDIIRQPLVTAIANGLGVKTV